MAANQSRSNGVIRSEKSKARAATNPSEYMFFLAAHLLLAAQQALELCQGNG
jgi:hypothetical protein